MVKSNKLTYLAVILNILFFKVQAQDSCNCESFIEKSGVEFTVFDNNDSSSYKLMTDETLSDYFLFHILVDSAEYLYVQPYNWYKGNKYTKGWILKHDYLHVNTKIYGESAPLKIYSKPDYQSDFNKIEQGLEQTCIVKGCNKDWLFVSFTIKDSKIEGWLAPEQQCANFETTCGSGRRINMHEIINKK